MADQKKQFIVKAKGMLCSGIAPQKLCYLRVSDGIIQAISDDMPGYSGDEIVDHSTLTLAPCFCDFHLHFADQAKAAAETIGVLLLRHGINRAYE
ncbi:MAG: hypothetical protein Q8K68_12700, partial [Nitrospirota bacterium]|nr:hypothetical protein [Nitrospirota bacterium]